MMGQLQLVHGIRTNADDKKPISKLDEYLQRLRGEQEQPISQDTDESNSSVDVESAYSQNTCSNNSSQGIIFTDSTLIAKKYKNTCAQDVRDIIVNFMLTAEEYDGLHWNLIDLGEDEMSSEAEM